MVPPRQDDNAAATRSPVQTLSGDASSHANDDMERLVDESPVSATPSSETPQTNKTNSITMSTPNIYGDGSHSLGFSGYGLPYFFQQSTPPVQTPTAIPTATLYRKNRKKNTTPDGSQDIPKARNFKRATASHLVVGGATSAYFVRPLLSCSEKLPHDATLEELWEHCSDPEHRMGLSDQGHYKCEIGCLEGFADTIHRLSHYADAQCTIEQVSDDKCNAPGCNWMPVTKPGGKKQQSPRTRIFQHYTLAHATAAYQSNDAPFKDHVCKLAFTPRQQCIIIAWVVLELEEGSFPLVHPARTATKF
jgi:hypothetical protein